MWLLSASFVIATGGMLPVFGAALDTTAQRPAQTVKLPEGRPLEVHGSLRVEPAKYVRASKGDTRGVIVIEQLKKVELDLTGVELRGAPAGTDLDRHEGWGIVVRDCEDVTIRGGTLGGYKGCIVAERTKRLTLDGITFDGFYGMHLRSTVDAEDQSDWLFPHENDADQWITNYGGAISLTECEGATIQGCKARHGQNGILLTRSNGASVEHNDFSFLSGWGLAMYRSSKALVRDNVLDYCVRGYSHGAYWRGQDSAGILMFERCSDNVFAWNSATHGGDGVFLFAGMDTVEGRAFAKGEKDAGGSDRNVWFENDFSFAVANAIEATFSSDNWAISNRLDGCHQHGVWGGYSRRMVMLNNSIAGTIGGGISIEHGQECAIVGNALAKNDLALELWWDEDKELVGGPFGKHRETASRDTRVTDNTFTDNRTDLSLRDTRKVELARNRWTPGGDLELVEDQTDESVLQLMSRDAVLTGSPGPKGRAERSSLAIAGADEPEWLKLAREFKRPPPPTMGGRLSGIPRRPEGFREGLDTIVMGEWGPWDFRSGESRPVAKKSGGLLADAMWSARWFSWKDKSDPREKLLHWRTLAEHPLVEAQTTNLSDPWGRDEATKSKVGRTHFGLVAKTTIELAERGRYTLSVLSDDGVRITVDGKPAIENWTWHAPTRDEATLELAKGKHELVLEYFQIDGAWALLPELVRAP